MGLLELGLRACPFITFIDLEKYLDEGKTIVLDGCFHDTLKFYFYNISVFPRFLERGSIDVFQFSPRNFRDIYQLGRKGAIDFDQISKTIAPYSRLFPAAGYGEDKIDPEYASKISSAISRKSKLVIDLAPYPHADNPNLVAEVEEGYPLSPSVLYETLTAIRDGLRQLKDRRKLPLCAVDVYDRDETPQLLALLDDIRMVGTPLLIFRYEHTIVPNSRSAIKAELTMWSNSNREAPKGHPIAARLSGGKKIFVRNPTKHWGR